MVRRRLLSNSAKQASMGAYQGFWQQQQQQQQPPHPQGTLVASMPQYWHSMCNKLGGAVPRLAMMAPPEASPKRVSRVRRQLVRAPREAAPNFVQQQVPLQRGNQTMWDRCCLTQGSLLKPGAFLPGFPGAPTSPQQHQQRSFQYQPGNMFSYPAAVQMNQLQWQQQPHLSVPAGILKRSSQMEACGLHNAKRVTIRQAMRRRFQAPSVEQVRPRPEVPPKPSKRTRQLSLRREQQRLLQHQLLCQKELQRQQQIQKALQKQQECQKDLQKQQQVLKELEKRQQLQKELQEQQDLQRELQKQREQQEKLQKQRDQQEKLQKQREQQEKLHKQQLQRELQKEHQKDLQKQQQLKELKKQQEHQKQLQKQQQLQKEHQLELEKMQEQLQQRKLKQQQLGRVQEHQELLEKRKNFNFGKYASNYLDPSSFQSESEVSHTGIPPTEPSNKPQSPNRNHNFSYEGTKLTPGKGEAAGDTRRREAFSRGRPRFTPDDLTNESSTITLTSEQCHFESTKSPYRSQTALADKATNTQTDPLSDLLKPATSITGKGSKARKLNINELLRSEKIRGLSAEPMWHSLMQLVAQMCESREQENQADQEAKSRLRAGSGAEEGRQRQYSVYLMVTSEEDEDESASTPNTEVESSRMTSEERIQADKFAKRCGNVYQAEHTRLGRRKRSRKRLNPRLNDLNYPFPNPLPLLPMRRPLHWPKPDYSKTSQGRSNRSRTPSRVRSRSSAKHLGQMHDQSSLSSVLDPKRSWRLWKDLPMTAKTLNKAYSRILTRSGGTASCTDI